MKINIVWDKYVVYDYGQENIAGFVGEAEIFIKNAAGNIVSSLIINTTERTIVKLPTLSKNPSYDIEIDDATVTAETQLPGEDPSAERDGIKISELVSTASLQQGDLFALSRDDGQDGSYNRTLHVTLGDLIAAINPAASYTLTVNGVTGGQVFPINPESYQEGSTVTAGITVDSGYNFISWTSDWPTLDGATDTQLNFNMPAQDVTLTPNVELADQSVWGTEMHSSSLGWTAWDPNSDKYSDGAQKTSNSNDDPFFYHVDGDTYTSILYISNEHAWLQEEISNDNYANLQLDYIDANDNVVTTSGGDSMSYTGAQLQEQYFHGSSSNWPAPQKLGINTVHPTLDDHAYVSMQFDQTYANLRVRITRISTGKIITSRNFIVYSDNNPVFGLGI